MFVETSKKQINAMEITTASYKKPSYGIKKLVRQLLKHLKSHKMNHHKKAEFAKKAEINEAFDSLDNTYTTDIEYDCASMLSFNKSDFNETLSTKALSCEIEDFDFSDISSTIPVQYIRNDNGTFFWTANNDIPVDNDLVEPLCCSTNNQLACIQDRWTNV